ncbi:hypothetical protein vBSlqSZDD2_42 [Serratia phage vB_SlqS_ZDD2]|nr:hypothetical protein vBSlqSZDD2_42 [Serratia phage vB_SlqS_ZDD2]
MKKPLTIREFALTFASRPDKLTGIKRVVSNSRLDDGEGYWRRVQCDQGVFTIFGGHANTVVNIEREDTKYPRLKHSEVMDLAVSAVGYRDLGKSKFSKVMDATAFLPFDSTNR